MSEMTPAERELRARLAAYVLHQNYDSRELTKACAGRLPLDVRTGFRSQPGPAAGGASPPSRYGSHGTFHLARARECPSEVQASDKHRVSAKVQAILRRPLRVIRAGIRHRPERGG